MISSTAHLITHAPAEVTSFREVDPLQIDNWDELVSGHPDSGVFHSQGWARVLSATYGYRPYYLLNASGSELRALLPLFEVRSWLTGIRGVSLPFTDSCPPLLRSPIGLDQLYAEAQRLGRTAKWRSLELRGVPLDFGAPSRSYFQHDLDLSPPESVLFEQCDPAMRRSIRKAQKEKIDIEIANSSEGLNEYYRLHQLTRQKHGVPPQSLFFFRNLFKYLIQSGYGMILLAKVENVAIAGCVFLRFGKNAIYKFGASDTRYQELRANNLLMWRAILAVKELGATTLSFGRTSNHQDGLRRFKRSFGATESVLYYAKYNFRTSEFFKEEADQAEGWQTNLFRHCPKFLARFIGKALYPHVG